MTSTFWFAGWGAPATLQCLLEGNVAESQNWDASSTALTMKRARDAQSEVRTKYNYGLLMPPWSTLPK